MAVTESPRLGLTRWGLATDPFTRAQIDGDNAALDPVVSIFAQGTLAARPAAGKVGRWYYATDGTPKMYYDTGTAWVEPFARLDQIITPTEARSMNGFRLTNLGQPAASTDAARRFEVDDLFPASTNLPGDPGVRSAGTSGKLGRSDHVHKAGITGEIKWGGWGSAPAGTYLCDGQLLLRTDEPDLFNAIGGGFNTGGEAVTTFRLPNLKGRVPVHFDAAQPDAFGSFGGQGGSKTHTLAMAEMPTHSHNGFSGGSVSEANQLHDQSVREAYYTNTYGLPQGGGYLGRPMVYSNSQEPPHNHAIANSGSGAAHNNLQPYLVLRAVIVR